MSVKVAVAELPSSTLMSKRISGSKVAVLHGLERANVKLLPLLAAARVVLAVKDVEVTTLIVRPLIEIELAVGDMVSVSA